ncbi:MAG: class I SAM-dependent methyltransferase [Deltaproteobacteria bacterium]
MIEAQRFREFEHSGWEAIPEPYHQAFGNLTTQAIEPLLNAVGTKKGIRIIDIASGPGYVAAAAAERGATVLGIDFSTAMVAHAQRLHPGVEFREGDAEELPLGNSLFDAAVMNFGILHLGRPESALGEAYRILRTGGRFAFSVWSSPQEAIAFGIVLRAVDLHGEPRVALPEGPPFFRFSDPEECTRGLRIARFEERTVTKIRQLWRLPAGDSLFNAMKDGTVRTAALLRAQKPTVLNKIRDAIREALEEYRKGDVVELPMPAWVASGVKSDD